MGCGSELGSEYPGIRDGLGLWTPTPQIPNILVSDARPSLRSGRRKVYVIAGVKSDVGFSIYSSLLRVGKELVQWGDMDGGCVAAGQPL